MDDKEASTKIILESSRFWVQKVLVPIFVVLGIAGSIITVVVLTRRRMRSSTNIYLTALAIADIIYLIFGWFLSFEHSNNIHDAKYELYWKTYGLNSWLFDAASATSAWLAVSFTVERFVAVCYPMKGKLFCTERKAKILIAIIYIFCLFTTASRTFEYTLKFKEYCERKCDPGERPPTDLKNSTVQHKLTHPEHTILFPYNSSFSSVEHYNEYFQNQLKSILANCTKNPHIIYVPIYPQFLNISSDKLSLNLIDTSQLIESKSGSIVAIDKNNNVLEKPPTQIISNETVQTPEAISNDTEHDNVSCCIPNHKVYIQDTLFGKNPGYKRFIYWYSAIFFNIIPFVLIATFNCFLVKAVYKSRGMRRTMTNNSQEPSPNNNEKRITIMLIGVVIIFLFCNVPMGGHLLYYHFHEPITPVEVNVSKILGNIFNLLVMVNAPCNFFLYCLLSKKFRSTFKKLFWDRRKKVKQLETETILLSRMKSSKKFNPYQHGLMKRNQSEYHTPRNLETSSLTSIPRSKSLLVRAPGKAKSTDLIV